MNKLLVRIGHLLRYSLLLFIITTFYSCVNKIDSGVVIDKKYRPSYVHLQPILCGKVTTLMPIHHPESYSLIIKNDSIKRIINVNKNIYEKYNIGDSIYFK